MNSHRSATTPRRKASLLFQSPLGRHPGLLVRKVAAKLHLYREDLPVPAPPVTAVVYPAHWEGALRQWVSRVLLHPAPHPFTRVFGQDFDEALLLDLCGQGPRRGQPGLMADIKLAWDFSRGQPLFTNAVAGPAQLELGAGFLRRWLRANRDTNGPTWTCAMEVAIRAVNWIFADVLLDGALGQQLGTREWAAWVWRHGYLIWRRLETYLVSSNHYLSDLLGLYIIGCCFPADPQARAWRRFAQAEMPRALLAQTRPDGGLAEASLRYHAFVTEMALLFRLALGASLPEPARERLRQMCRIVADFSDASGDVFAIGDDDSGRVLALDFASSMGRASILLQLAAVLLEEDFKPAAEAVYPQSGWWVRRAGDFAAALDFGGVGLHGIGSHAHNDDFSFCLDWRQRTVIADPGTFLYTSDLAARNRFKSTLAHNTLILDGAEQRGFSQEPFELFGRDEAFESRRVNEQTWAFTRPVGPGLAHQREVSVSVSGVAICDRVEGAGQRELQWRFHLHPAVQPRLLPHGFALAVPGAGTLRLEAPEATPALEILPAEYSPGYGLSSSTRVCVARMRACLPAAITWQIRPAEGD